MAHEISLPWPPKELSPNARVHWTKKARSAKAYKEACFWLTKAAGWPNLPTGYDIPLTVTFHPPDLRRRDDDNFEAAWKCGRDGVAAAWGVDDNRFQVTRARGEPVKGGAVIVRINRTSGNTDS